MSRSSLLNERLFSLLLFASLVANCFRGIELSAQNLVPNGSFEQTSFFEYEFPFSAFAYVRDWQTASFQNNDSTLLTTPDLFISGGTVPAAPPVSFWNVINGAASGANYVGLTNIATQDGAFLPESIAAVLNEPLEAGAFYALNLDYRNKGRDNILPEPMMCIEEELKKLVFYFDDQPITVSLDQVANISTSSSDQAIELHTASMELYEVLDWENIGTCFQAIGNERHITLSMTPGRVEVYPPCVILDEYFDLFLHYYFDVDNIRLEKIPTEFNLKAQICAGGSTTINLRDSLLLPTMLSPAYFTVDGVTVNDLIEVNSSGEYLANARLDCTTIPIIIEVTEVECTPRHFAPTVFSPNFDGLNDEWKVYLNPDAAIADFSLTIFDRWGAVVFETKDTTEGWTGNHRNAEVNAGTYAWVLQYTFIHPERGPLAQLDGGDLLLLR